MGIGVGTFFARKFYFIKLDIGVIFLVTFFISLSVIAAWFDKVERDLYGVRPGVTLNNKDCSRMMLAEVRVVVEDMAIRYRKLPLEPVFDKDSGNAIAGKSGCIIDVKETIQNVLAADENQKIAPVIIKVDPKYKISDLDNITNIKGTYSTWFHGSGARYNNIGVASKSLNLTIIWPGETFSFNEAVGPRTPERGYSIAPVISDAGMDYGGGVCQVSSTLYNAALNAHLQICERHQHSRPISYVPEGRDATVAYDYLDLKIKNNNLEPVIIRAGLNNGRVWAQILGGIN